VADLLVIVPSRGRPESVARVVEAWTATAAWETADLLFAVDADDPAVADYRRAVRAGSIAPGVTGAVWLQVTPTWIPMVHKLDDAARTFASEGYLALAFAGDDHLPRSVGWAGRYLAELRELGTGIVYGDDLIQGERLPTQWAMTSDIVRALGRMVPAPVEHLACDDSILALGKATACIRYLPDVVIEHMHPIAGKAAWDEGYRRVNRQEQYRKDLAAFADWRHSGLAEDAAKVRALREVRSGSA